VHLAFTSAGIIRFGILGRTKLLQCFFIIRLWPDSATIQRKRPCFSGDDKSSTESLSEDSFIKGRRKSPSKFRIPVSSRQHFLASGATLTDTLCRPLGADLSIIANERTERRNMLKYARSINDAGTYPSFKLPRGGCSEVKKNLKKTGNNRQPKQNNLKNRKVVSSPAFAALH
jgi:hypothetical protein